METEILNQVDLLCKMAFQNESKEQISLKLERVEQELADNRLKLSSLDKDKEEDSYVNSSLELVDKNIQVSLTSKIAKLNYQISDLDTILENLKSEEEKTYNYLQELNSKIENNKQYLVTLKTNANKNSIYENVLAKEEKHQEFLENERKSKQKEYEEILKNLELNTQAEKELLSKKEQYDSRLLEIKNSLKNPNSYVDLKAQKQYEEEKQQLLKKQKELETERLELLCNPSIITNEAKEMILHDNKVGALNKVQELYTIVKNRPYMDIEDDNSLNQELDKLESQRRELVGLIDNKDYTLNRSEAINKRLIYLQNKKRINEKWLEKVAQEIDFLTSFSNDTLALNIWETEKDSQDIHEKWALRNEEGAILVETQMIDNILETYKKELINVLERKQVLENWQENWLKEQTNINQEISEINDFLTAKIKVEDWQAKEEDKQKLNELNEKIKDLKYRLSFEGGALKTFKTIEDYLKGKSSKETNIEALETDTLFKVIDIKKVETLREDS